MSRKSNAAAGTNRHPAIAINAHTAAYCYLDFDLDGHRSKLAAGAAFVHATNARYGFSSRDARLLGGSEVTRIPELQSSDPEWHAKPTLFRPLLDAGCGGRVVVRLHWDVAPLACQNFAALCANGSPPFGPTNLPLGDSGKPLTYRNTRLHRVVPGFVVQGGDLVFGNGSGGESALGTKSFKDERAGLQQKHDRRGLVGMGNSGKHSNTSQFYVTLAAAPQCDGKHVVFGHVVSGWSVLDKIERCGRSGRDSHSEEPTVEIVVTDCGLWAPLATPGCGYWFDRPDPESYTGISPVLMVRPRVAVVAPSPAVGDRFRASLGTRCCFETPTLVWDETDSSSADGEASRESVRQAIHQLLSTFTVDVVFVAPACAKGVRSMRLELPESWTTAASDDPVALPQVVLECKPAEAFQAIQTQSWLSRRGWPLEGGGA